MVIWLPPFCSDVEPIERLWRNLKDLACANKLEGNIEEVVRSTEKIMMYQNDPLSNLHFHISKKLMMNYLGILTNLI